MNLYQEGVENGKRFVLETMKDIIESDYTGLDKENALYFFNKVRRIFSEIGLEDD